MADETSREESKEGIVLVALHDRSTRDFTWNKFIVSQLSKIIPIFGNFVTWQAWTEPLNEISVVLTLNVNGINFILIEMAMILLWKFNIFAILAKVNLNGVLSKFVQEMLHGLSLFRSDSSDVLVWYSALSEVLRDYWIESFEE